MSVVNDTSAPNGSGPALPPEAWIPAERIAFVLCHTREPGHTDNEGDFCLECREQADRVLDESEVANALWVALMDMEGAE